MPSRVCIIAHDLSPSEGAGWHVLEKALQSAAEAPVLLHTGAVGPEVSGAVRARVGRMGAEYRHIDELPAPFSVPVFPAVEAHRHGVRIAYAVGQVPAAEYWFADRPAHAASLGAARRCGWPGGELKIVLHIAELAEAKRVAAGVFPTGGREAIAVEFLERRAVGFADEVVCADEKLAGWLRQSRWRSAAGVSDPGSPRSAPPKISVCVTYYEKAPYLREALDSLAVQSLRPFEVIVIDDGSRSAEAAAAWKKAEDRYWPLGWKFIRQDNAGPSAARNRGAAEATGDALLFCDADNRFRPEMIATLSRAMERSSADCIACAFQAFQGDGEHVRASHVFAPLGPCLELALLENVLGDTTSLFRKSALAEAGGFHPGLINEDWRLLLEWIRAGRSYETVPAVLFDYRVADSSRSQHESEYESAVAVVGPLLAADPTLSRLWPHVAGLIRDPAVGRLERELLPVRAAVDRWQAEAERLKQDRDQLAHGLEIERAAGESRLGALREVLNQRERLHTELEQAARVRDRMRRAHIVLLEYSAQERQAEAAAIKDTVADLRRKLAALTDTSTRDAAAAAKEIAALRGRMERMQASYSWQATAPFRAMRRGLIDPLKRKPAPRAAAALPALTELPIAFHIDAPRLWDPEQSETTVRGWVFAKSTHRLRAVRARIGARLVSGTYGQERPDLAGIFPEWPAAAACGFKIPALFLPSDQVITLEGEDEEGAWHAFFHHALGRADTDAPRGTYEHWLREHPGPDATALERLRAAGGRLPEVRISILMPVYNPAEKWLQRALDSVQAQTYPHWELCIADDASTQEHVWATLERFAQGDPRVKLMRRPKNGHISAATNSALALATGEFTALFDHDDELAPHALHCIVAEIAAHPDADLIYTDEDKIDEQGSRFDPHFKPDWNPELLTGQNYLSHLAIYRTSLLRALGGLREGFEGCQDWDLALRATERLDPRRIRHIPRVLYHWRANEGSTAMHLGEKSYIVRAAQRTLEDHFKRLGLGVSLEPTVGGHWHVTYPLPRERPLVSIIIPTRNAGPLVKLCLASLFARTNYAPFEVLLVDNRSDDPESLEIFAAAERDDDVRVLRYDEPFNYSKLNNFAAREARGELLCLLNNDIEVLAPSWLDEMVAQAIRAGVGAVGARLYYPDLRVQHAGVITGLGGVAGHGFKYFERADPGTPQFRPHLTQNLSVVTAACLVIRKAVYFEAGGLEEEKLTIAFNDVDFCLKVEALGYRNVYTPFAELIHHESASRGREDTPEKIRRFQSEIVAIKERWGERLLNDPAYNPNLSLDTEDFALAYPPRVPPLL